MPGEPIIEMHKVSVSKGTATLLKEVDLTIREGERLVILGPNGSGKSSLIKTMMGEHRHDTSVTGSYVKLRGSDLWNLFDVRKAFGLVSADLQVDLTRDMDCLEAVLSGFFGSIGTNRSQEIGLDMERLAKGALDAVGSSHLAERRYYTLSTGEARRVLMARALVNSPEALILDEPMNSLDLTGKRLVRAAIRNLAKEGRSLVLVTHDPADIVPEINRVVMIKDGRVFRDGGLQLLNEDNLSILYDGPIGLRFMEDRYMAWPKDQ
ncbi:putative ABC transporter ATP-binding protein YlmA [anaerobic digester metagenome]|jgi:iron complex transport system ATP-binding protein|nr:ATP-binding cassette domain-containing protein [Methanomassiliicoccales archaeon]